MNADTRALYVLLGELIAGIGTEGLGRAAFAVVRQAISADHVVANLVSTTGVVGLFTEGLLPPRIARTLNQRYLERYHFLDKSLGSSWEIGKGLPVAIPFEPGLNASPAYNTFFFERAGLCDKISVISTRGERMVSCSFYRLTGSGKFTRETLQQAQALALPLTAALWLHVEQLRPLPAQAGLAPAPEDAARRQAVLSLSPRELAVCQRLLAGASNEGVALDLSVSIDTVRTLRKRIYKKLQVNSVGDLFSRYLHVFSAPGWRHDRPGS